jgi:hypothetical protein
MSGVSPRIRALPLCLMILLIGCGTSPNALVDPTTTPTVTRATVTDLSVPFASSEADALVARGFLGTASLGRLDVGCAVDVIKTTDRAAQVKLVSCPHSQNIDRAPPVGTQGWVAKSALDLK